MFLPVINPTSQAGGVTFIVNVGQSVPELKNDLDCPVRTCFCSETLYPSVGDTARLFSRTFLRCLSVRKLLKSRAKKQCLQDWGTASEGNLLCGC